MHDVAIYWLRRDFRLADNPALTYVCETARRVVIAYLHAPHEEAPWQPGAASRWWLHHSLTSLSKSLQPLGQTIVLRTLRESDSSLETLRALIAETKATLIAWNRLYEPAFVARDQTIKSALRDDGLEVQSCNAALLFEPWQIQTQQAQPYKVFTPYWRTCASQLETLPPPRPAPSSVPEALPLPSHALSDLQLLPTLDWDAGFKSHWQPGENGAHAALTNFIDHLCIDYPSARDLPATTGTSSLSPHLHFGEIGPRQIIATLRAQPEESRFIQGRDSFVRELGWREFANHVLYHYPQTTTLPFDTRFNDYPWEKNIAQLRAWQRGRTGIPIIDAGMRELWHTGYMHNRVRMLVASLLTKNLRMHWLEGAHWFWDTLVDANLANNTLGWQWTAGCGTDAAPYFRVFNPVVQGERFDAQGKYVRRWVPELAALPDKWIHQPWNAPLAILEQAQIRIGSNYPEPIVDLKGSRDRALDGYQSLRARQ